MFNTVLILTLINGLMWGGIYAILALGLSMIWSTTKVINFSHGSIYVWAGYIWIFTYLIIRNYLAASIISVIFALFLGFVLEKGIVSPIKKKHSWELNCILGLLAVSMILDSLALYIWGPYPKRIPPISENSITIGGYNIYLHHLVTIIVGISAIIFLSFFLKNAKMGMAMRAIANDVIGASIIGINTNKVSFYAFGIGGALAGLGAIFLGNIFIVDPLSGGTILLKAFIIIIIGGLGSFKGTISSAFIIGVAESIFSTYLGLNLTAPFLFLIMLLVLVVKPSGLFQ